MNRTEKKCLVGSLIAHSLLAVVLVVGPAFAPSRPPPVDDLPILDFIPAKLVDDLLSGGGDPGPPPPAPAVKKETPAPAPPVVTPPEPKPIVKPAPPVEKAPPVETKKAKIEEPDDEPSDSVAARAKPERRTIKLSDLKRIKPNPNHEASSAKERAAREREAAIAARNKLIEGVAGALRRSLSNSTTITSFGMNGTGGPAYANYAQAVKSIFDRAWYDPPRDGDSDSLSVEVQVTIARSGEILSARITRPSSNSALDRSVRRALDRVKSVPPFPEGAKEDQRNYTILYKLDPNR